MKKILILGMFILVISVFGGCGVESTLEIKDDGTTFSETHIYLSEWENDFYKIGDINNASKKILEKCEFTYNGKVEINGEKYNNYVTTGTSTVEKDDSMIFEQGYFLTSIAQSDFDNSLDSNNVFSKYLIHVKLPFEVNYSNGIIHNEDKHIVTFDLKEFSNYSGILYAGADEAKRIGTNIKINIVDGKLYRKDKKVSITTDGIVEKFTINGLNQDLKNATLMEGENKICIRLLSGTTIEKICDLDTIKPETNIENNEVYKKVRIKFKDNKKGSGIKKATLNGKKIKNNKLVKKKGGYRLKIIDKAGNKKEVTFFIA